MADMSYLEFDLVVERDGDAYRVRVVGSPVGGAAGEFKQPFSPLELENFQLRLGRSARGVRRIDSPEMEFAKTFGGRLFAALFNGDVRGCLRSSLDDANRQSAGLRVRLNLSGAPELADLPWEFLYNPTLNRFLALSDETPLVRYLDLPERIRPLKVTPPIRVLLMVSSPTDYPRLDVDREGAKVTDAVADLERRGLLTVDRLENATLAELQRALRNGPYHIFHFIGHGGFDEKADNGVLMLEDAQERGRLVSAQFLGVLLKDHRPLRLAVLNACEGARASRRDPFGGTAQTLVQQGVPAVIAMQFEISDEAAICFTHEFYSAVAAGYPVDAALAEARKAIFAQVNEIEWGTPVLYMRSPDGRIFDIEQIPEADRKQAEAVAAAAAAAGREQAEAVRARAAEEERRAQDARLREAQAEQRRMEEERRADEQHRAEEQRRAEERRRDEEEGQRQEAALRGAAASPASAREQTPRGSRAKFFIFGGVAATFVLVLGGIVIVLALIAVMGDQKSEPLPSSPNGSGAAQTPAEPVGLAPPSRDRVTKQPEAAGSAPPAGKDADSAEELRRSVRAFLRRVADADIRAYRTLDVQALQTVYSGDALEKKVADLLQTGGIMYLVARMYEQTIEDLAPTPDGARVEVREVWSATAHVIATGQCVSRIPKHTARQSMLLSRDGDRWMVESFTDRDVTPAAVPCE